MLLCFNSIQGIFIAESDNVAIRKNIEEPKWENSSFAPAVLWSLMSIRKTINDAL